jgi:uncharacterized protein (DUF305 family)
MSTRSTRFIAKLLIAAPVFACAPLAANAQAPLIPAAKIDSGRYGYTKADVAFISGMIGHHAQAVVMAGWAPSHGVNSSLAILCRRIAVAQTAEIELMQEWLKARNEKVPDPNAKHDMAGMAMPGMAMDTLMPGMLSPEQMAQLDKARGVEFDRLFLKFMIQHHEGALSMVAKLFGTHGAAQDDFVFTFATNVHADQETEIARMLQMLDALPPERRNP